MSRDIELGQIRPDPDQPRQHFREEKIQELAQSLKAKGQAVPIAVRPEDGGYVIIHGERRWRAAKQLGWETIAADVQDVTAETARWRSLVENIQREDLTPMEEARAYQRQLDRHDLTQSELGERIGKSQSYVAQKLRLLRLPSPLSFFLERDLLSEGHARQLMKIEGVYLNGATIERDPSQMNVEEWEFGSVRQAINHERPLDWPPLFLRPDDEDSRHVVRAALKRLYDHAGDDGETDAWVTAAWCYGLAAWHEEMSVSVLTDTVGYFTDLLESHMGFFFSRAPWPNCAPDAPSIALTEDVIPEELSLPKKRKEQGTAIENLPLSALRRWQRGEHHWGALSDLRHAGLLRTYRATWLDGATDSQLRRAPDDVDRPECELSAEQMEANQERLLECIGAVSQRGSYVPPSKLGAPGTVEGSLWAATQQHIQAAKESAL